jgi:hypothetical protein
MTKGAIVAPFVSDVRGPARAGPAHRYFFLVAGFLVVAFLAASLALS